MKAPHSKCGILARVSRVRIPPSPPLNSLISRYKTRVPAAAGIGPKCPRVGGGAPTDQRPRDRPGAGSGARGGPKSPIGFLVVPLFAGRGLDFLPAEGWTSVNSSAGNGDPPSRFSGGRQQFDNASCGQSKPSSRRWSGHSRGNWPARISMIALNSSGWRPWTMDLVMSGARKLRRKTRVK